MPHETPPVARRLSADERLDLELADHLERRTADLVAGGLSPAAARAQARRESGGLAQTRERCRDVRRGQRLAELVRDVRIGFRALARERLFAASVTAILALGIGSSVAMFGLLHAIVLRPLPYADPSALAVVTTQLIAQNQTDGSSIPNLLDWRAQSRTLAGLTFHRRTHVSMVTVTLADAPLRVQEGLVGPEFFTLLGASPLLGRTFGAGEFDRRERVVVLGQRLWREHFAGSTAAIGRTLVVDGVGHTVIGVMPDVFQAPTRETRLWRPVSLLPNWDGAKAARDGDGFEVIARLAPQASVADAQTELSVIAARLRAAHESNRNLDVRVTPLVDHVVGRDTRRRLWLGAGAVLSLLAIACLNVGGLLTLRAARRRHELALRAALGAGRGRLVRQLLAETLTLWAAACPPGLAIAWGLLQGAAAFVPAFPRIEQAGFDATALGVALVGSFLVVTLCGVLPSLVAARTDAAAAFVARGDTTRTRRLFQDVLITAQMAAALMLLVGAVLLARSFVRAYGEDPGYPASNLVVARLDLPRAVYPGVKELGVFFHAARERIGQTPGVIGVASMTDFFVRRHADQRVTVEGRSAEREEGIGRLSIETVTPGFFAASGIAIVEGRDLDERDLAPDAPRVFIVNETLARRFWPGESPIGKRMVGGAAPPRDGRWSTVVGVARDMRREGLDRQPIASAFTPGYLRGMDLVVRTSASADTRVADVRRALRDVDAALPVASIAAVDDGLAARLSGRRFDTLVLGVFAMLAVLLSAAGIYAALAASVAARTREIGIRTALGANRRAILVLILRRGVALAITGAAIGLLGAAGVARGLQALLYNTATHDLASFAAAIVVILATGVVASLAPALRAARVDPLIALRHE